MAEISATARKSKNPLSLINETETGEQDLAKFADSSARRRKLIYLLLFIYAVFFLLPFVLTASNVDISNYLALLFIVLATLAFFLVVPVSGLLSTDSKKVKRDEASFSDHDILIAIKKNQLAFRISEVVIVAVLLATILLVLL